MRVAFHSVEKIGSPFLAVDEYVFPIPPSGHVVHNRVRKFLFLFEGSCRHEVGSADRTFHSVLVASGDILLVPHTCQQRYVPLDVGATARIHALRLAFDPDTLAPLPLTHRRTAYAGDTETNLAAFVRHHFQEFRHLPGGQNGPVRALLEQLREEAERRPPGHRLRVGALCVDLVMLVARQFLGGAGTTAAPTSQRVLRVQQAKEYILRHASRPLGLAPIATHVQLSEEHLARIFKQETGQTLLEYARHVRLEQAKTLLIGSPNNVSEIAVLTGFSSVSLFSRNFRRYVGVSPLAYRQRLVDRAR